MMNEDRLMDRNKLLDRVRKLYAMSRETESSPHEAEIALRRCESLMARFGITEADLETSDFGTTTLGETFRSVPTHVRVLSSAVGLLHDCLAVKNRGTMEFRGYSIDAEVAALTYEYLKITLERSLRRRKEEGAVAGGRKPSYDYRIGFALAVAERCRTIDRERRQAAQETLRAAGSTGSSLVVRKLEMVREACSQDLVGGSRARIRYRPGAAHASGRSDGTQVSLDRQIAGRQDRELS